MLTVNPSTHFILSPSLNETSKSGCISRALGLVARVFDRAFAGTGRAIVVLCLCVAASSAYAQPDVRQVWQLLDYLAVDYAGAVRDGEVISASEFEEMSEFSKTVTSHISQLPEQPERATLISKAQELSNSIAAKAPPTQVAVQARSLAEQLVRAYPIALAPAKAPDLAKARTAYQSLCSSCHGLTGAADSALAKTLDPPPIAFTVRDRARQRSPLGYFSVITQGVSGTAMASFAQLADEERWGLAFYASTLSFTPQDAKAGADVWTQTPATRKSLPNLESLARTSEEQLASSVGEARARALLAFLRANPSALSTDSSGYLQQARQNLRESVDAYTAGDASDAERSALAAYLDGIEPIEPALAAKNADLLRRVEDQMGRYRSLIREGASKEAAATQARSVEGVLQLIEHTIDEQSTSPSAAFLGSFTILLREGLEALLIVVAIIAFLRKANRPELLRYVHGGWVGALLAGVLTWAIATYFINISGANREVTEGLSSIFAAVVLLSVGLWMHGKSLAGRWQEYLTTKLSHALSQRSAWFLAGLAFIAVYREVFETILFYAALWTEGEHTAIVIGLLAASVALAAISYVLLKATRRLPIGRFFSVSAVFVGVLAVVLTGKGIAALQEAGWLDLHPFGHLRVDLLGIYPNAQGLLAQLAVILVSIAGFAFNHRSARRAHAATK